MRRGSPARSNSRHGRRAALRTARGRALPTAGRPVGLSFVRADGPVDAHGHRRSARFPPTEMGLRWPPPEGLGQAARARHVECTVRRGLLDRGRSCALQRAQTTGQRPRNLNPRGSRHSRSLGLSTGCLPSCKLGPGADLAALTSQRPEAGTRLPVRHPQLAPIRLRFRHGFFGRPAGRGWYVRRGPQGRVLRHPAGRSKALSHLRVRSRTLNPKVQLSLPRAQARPMAATTKAAYHGQARPWCSYTIHMPKTTQVQ